MASAAAASSNYAAGSSYTTHNDPNMPKFSEYRSRVMLGELPPDFLRLDFSQTAMFNPQGYPGRQGHLGVAPAQQHLHNPNFLGLFTLTIAEAKLVKSSGLLGLMKMDPYVTFRIGHVLYDTPTATSGGKNPQWKAAYRINLFKGMDSIHLEVYDQRNFTEDSFIGEADIPIPREVMDGETRQHWYPLMGRNATANENQGDILIVMSLMPVRASNQPAVASSSAAPVVNPEGAAAAAAATATASSRTRSTSDTVQHSPSAIPKPPPPPYSQEDVRTIEEMFPTTDRRMIVDLLNRHAGDKDAVVNHLLQNIA